jgi:hypothetical protein
VPAIRRAPRLLDLIKALDVSVKVMYLFHIVVRSDTGGATSGSVFRRVEAVDYSSPMLRRILCSYISQALMHLGDSRLRHKSDKTSPNRFISSTAAQVAKKVNGYLTDTRVIFRPNNSWCSASLSKCPVDEERYARHATDVEQRRSDVTGNSLASGVST